MKEKYNELVEEFIGEFPEVDKSIIEKTVKRGLEDGRLPFGIMHEITMETGAIPISELKEYNYYIANSRLYSLNKAEMIYKQSSYTEYYVSENGNYFVVELKYPEETREKPLSKGDIEKITDVEKTDITNKLISNNEVFILATKFPEVFLQLEEV